MVNSKDVMLWSTAHMVEKYISIIRNCFQIPHAKCIRSAKQKLEGIRIHDKVLFKSHLYLLIEVKRPSHDEASCELSQRRKQTPGVCFLQGMAQQQHSVTTQAS